MEEGDLITKKELLKLTGISYGQLYRWKRENLIPESWFIKRASYTGQETFFPREKILGRIAGILELKDKYSLEEVADMLSPELTNRIFNSGDLRDIRAFDSEVRETFEKNLGKSYFNFIELIFIFIVSKLIKESVISSKHIDEFIESMKNWFPVLNSTSYMLIVFEKDTVRFFLLARQDSHIFHDNGTRELTSYDLDEVSKELNLILQDQLKK